MILTSVNYTFTLTLNRASLSTPISTRLWHPQGSASRASHLRPWRLDWRLFPPRLVLVKEIGHLTSSQSTTQSRDASLLDRGTVSATISVEHASGTEDELTPSKRIACDYGTWTYDDREGEFWARDRCQVGCEELCRTFEGADPLPVSFVVTVQIGEDERATHLTNDRVIDEHRVMSKTIGRLRSQYRVETRRQQDPHDVHFVFNPSDRTLYANCKILRSRSSYYERVLTSGFLDQICTISEAMHTLRIDEDRPDTFQTFATALTWVHTGLIKFNSDDPSETSPDPESIYRLADQLLLDDLCAQAFEAFPASLTPSNVVRSLFSTFSCDFTPVRDFCIHFYVSHGSLKLLE
ncbi:BQ2448_7210 [Microbotryum intermedium]|uniref:BQ2448_7210 protein n=1 Tax=Microbotryum intermedium TaxID=269621 RepID=A0A238FN17_9BASI|nr:BQ2448_7210 [Microbotryum intermedium]